MGTNEIIAEYERLAAEREHLAAERERLLALTQQLQDENHLLKERLLLARRKQFGTSSEKIDSTQLALVFDEAEATLDRTPREEVEKETVTYTRKKKTVGHREEMVADLPTEVVEHKLPEEEQVCSCCGGHLHEMSTQTRDELVIVPAQAKIVKHVRYIYACRQCDRNADPVPIVAAPAPRPLIPKSLASASSVSYIMGLKYVEAMPLYRMETNFERLGIKLSRSLLSNWVIKGGELLAPLYDRMKRALIQLDIVHADETGVQVLHEDGRAAQTDSWMWLYRSGRESPPIILYEYQPQRLHAHPKTFLAGFAGYLHSDGYEGYEKIGDNVTSVGCWAHARRYFVDAASALPKKQRNNPDHLANIAIKKIKGLFDIESSIDALAPAERKAAREEKSQPILDDIMKWLEAQSGRVPPKSHLGKGVGYCLRQWPKLIGFLADGRLEITNNRAERSIKPFVIGRKNWLFANTPRGARTSAVIYSIVETAKENGLNPYRYLEYALGRLCEVEPDDTTSLDALLPWNEAVKSALA